MSQQSAKLAKFLLEIKAIKLSPKEPFTWTSGIKSPIYCDNRMVLSFPEVRNFVAESLAGLITKEFPAVDRVAGIATAGIAHGALCADRMGISYCYVRPEPKKHGLKNQVEGYLAEGDKVVLVEDLISTGKSSIQAVDGVKLAGGKVIGLVALFTYGFANASEKFVSEGIPVFTLTNFDTLCEVAAAEGYIAEADIASIKAFAANPSEWGANL
jgi:orotate phosphoribosyltransferase